jgi:hypothetical protein
LRRASFQKGDIIATQGDPADCMHFILGSRVAVIVQLRDGHTIRVRSLGFHTTVGEMGPISRQKRSAPIKAEADSVLYALNVEAYQRITRENPALGHALLTYVIAVMADRLTFASKAMGVANTRPKGQFQRVRSRPWAPKSAILWIYHDPSRRGPWLPAKPRRESLISGQLQRGPAKDRPLVLNFPRLASSQQTMS